MIHGFLASSILYTRCYQKLSEKYTIYSLDILGMGLSSRQDFQIQSAQECIDYFMNSIEQWRKNNNLTKFSICGHSFGGYLAANYLLRYPQFIEKTFLISPIGIKQIDRKNQRSMLIQLYKEQNNISGKLYVIFMHFAWKFKILPIQVYQNCIVLGKVLLKQYFHTRFSFDNKQESKNWNQLFLHYAQMKISSEKSIHQMFFFPGLTANISIQQQINNNLKLQQQLFQKPIIFYYGDKDWICREGAKELQKNPKLQITIKEIQNSGHQITMHNPQQLSQFIVDQK